MKKYFVTTALLILVISKDIYAQGVNNIVRAYQVETGSGNSNSYTDGFICFYDPGKVKILSKSGAPQSPVVYFYYNGDLRYPMNSKAMASTYIPGYTLPPINRNFAVVEKQDLVIIKKILDANKIIYPKDLNPGSVSVAFAASSVKSWEAWKAKK